MALKFTNSYLEDSLAVFRYYKKLGERAMEQVTDEHLFTTLDEEANSIAFIERPKNSARGKKVQTAIENRGFSNTLTINDARRFQHSL
jgi:hypothetical protein